MNRLGKMIFSRRQTPFFALFGTLLASQIGCQTMPFQNPTRVPPPSTRNLQNGGDYYNSSGLAPNNAVMPASGAATAGQVQPATFTPTTQTQSQPSMQPNSFAAGPVAGPTQMTDLSVDSGSLPGAMPTNAYPATAPVAAGVPGGTGVPVTEVPVTAATTNGVPVTGVPVSGGLPQGLPATSSFSDNGAAPSLNWQGQ